MSKCYVTIDSYGGLGFYVEGISTNIPSTAYEISEADYNTFFSNQQYYTFQLVNGIATLIALTDTYIASDYGLAITMSKSNIAVPSGNVSFASSPTGAELTVAFPSTAGAITCTITKNATEGDTVTIGGRAFTASSAATPTGDFIIGSTIIETAQNLVNAINSDQTLTLTYNAIIPSTPDGTFTITEKIPGNGSSPIVATYTGTIVILSENATTSVYGYKNAYMCQQLKLLTATYVSKLTQVKRGLLDAYTLGNNTSVTALKALRLSVVSEYNMKAQAIING